MGNGSLGGVLKLGESRGRSHCVLGCAAFLPAWQRADAEEELSADEEPSRLLLTPQRLKGFAGLGLCSSSFQMLWLLFRFSGAIYSVRISRLSFFFFFSPGSCCYC